MMKIERKMTAKPLGMSLPTLPRQLSPGHSSGQPPAWHWGWPGGRLLGLPPEHHHGHSLFPQRRVCQYRYTKWQATYEHWSGFSCFFLKKKKREKTIQYRKPVCSHFNISNSFDVMLHSSLVSNPKFCKEKNQRCANKAGNQVHAPVCWHIAAPRNRSTESKQCSGTEGAALDTESKVYGLY